MERGIDHHIMRNIRKHLHGFLNNAKRNGVMQRRQRQTLFDLPQAFAVKDRRLFKIPATMDKAVPHGVHADPVFDNILRRQTGRFFMIGNIDNILDCLTSPIVFDIGTLCPFDPYPIGLSFENKIDLTGFVKIKDFIAQRRAPCVKDQYMHNVYQN